MRVDDRIERVREKKEKKKEYSIIQFFNERIRLYSAH